MYTQLCESDLSIPSSICKYSSVTGPLFRYDSNGKGSNVLASWADQAQININNQDQSPGKVQSVDPLTPGSTYINGRYVLYVWGLMICVTFEHMDKTR